MNLQTECLNDCAMFDDKTKTFNVHGKHSVDSECVDDIVPKPASPNNNPCTPTKVGSSVNWVKE